MSLGVAIVVGALFSVGAIMAQAWAATLQRRDEVLWRVYGNTLLADLDRLIKKRAELADRIEKLRNPHPNNTESNSSPSS